MSHNATAKVASKAQVYLVTDAQCVEDSPWDEFNKGHVADAEVGASEQDKLLELERMRGQNLEMELELVKLRAGVNAAGGNSEEVVGKQPRPNFLNRTLRSTAFPHSGIRGQDSGAIRWQSTSIVQDPETLKAQLKLLVMVCGLIALFAFIILMILADQARHKEQADDQDHHEEGEEEEDDDYVEGEHDTWEAILIVQAVLYLLYFYNYYRVHLANMNGKETYQKVFIAWAVFTLIVFMIDAIVDGQQEADDRMLYEVWITQLVTDLLFFMGSAGFFYRCYVMFQ